MMATIVEKLSRLNELIAREKASYDVSQRLQFDWLQGIKAQLDSFGGDSADKPASPITPPVVEDSDVLPIANLTTIAEDRRKSEVEEPPIEIPAPGMSILCGDRAVDSESEVSTNSPILRPMGRCATMPIFSQMPQTYQPGCGSTFRFVDDDSLLDNSDSSNDVEEDEDDASEPIPFTVSGSMRELTESAASFREKWQEMLHMKKACTNLPKKQAKIFAFEEDEEAVPEGYQISDDDDSDRGDDDDIYERNPVEIHGKMIPIWARGEQLLKQLRRQKRIDPDSIFSGFTADCSLSDIFQTQKPRWQNRNDSGWWDSDRVTEEEVAQFKAVLGIE